MRLEKALDRVGAWAKKNQYAAAVSRARMKATKRSEYSSQITVPIIPHMSQMNFIGIGAPNCGTTWLSAQLEARPQIGFAPNKGGLLFRRYIADLPSD
jgi:hypothetical protein